MSKAKAKPKAEKNEKKVQEKWDLSGSHKKLLDEMLARHNLENQPLQKYQRIEQFEMLDLFAKEIGVPKGARVAFNAEQRAFLLQKEV